MKLKNRSRWVRRPLHGIAAALIAFLVAWAVRSLLHPFLNEKLPVLFFFLAAVCVAFRYGIWNSLLCVALSVPTTIYYFVPPFGQWAPVDKEDIYLLVYYFMTTIVCALLFERVNRERYNSELLSRVADSRYRLMVELDEDRRKRDKRIHDLAATARPEAFSPEGRLDS